MLKVEKYNKAKSAQKQFLSWIGFGLSFALCLKIIGYFTLSESLAVTRVLKILIRFFSTGVLGLIYWSLLQRGFFPSFKFKYTLAPLLYFGYLFMGFASLLWTSNPFYSTLQLLMTSETIIFVYWFLSIYFTLNHYFKEEALYLGKLLSGAIFPILLIFVVGKYFDPDRFFRLTHGGEVARLGGYLMNPNELGMLAVVGIATALLDWHKRTFFWSNFIVGLMFYALILTSSRSSLIGLSLVFFLFAIRSNKVWIKFSIVAGAIIAAPILFNTVIVKQGDLQEVLSMTGRIPFWKALLDEGLVKSPWLGFGYMRIAEGDYFISLHSYAARMTHNTFIQVLMNLGFVGFFIVIMQMVATFYAFLKSKQLHLKTFFAVVFIPIFINSLTEFGIFGENNFGILFYQFLIILFCIEYRPHFTSRQKLKLRLHQKRFYGA